MQKDNNKQRDNKLTERLDKIYVWIIKVIN